MGRGSCASGPRTMMPGASLYRWRTTDQELARNSSSRYSIHYLLRNRAVWAWVCPSAGRSLRPMVAGCGLSRSNPRAPSFILCYWPTLRCLLVLQDESNPTTSPWCPAHRVRRGIVGISALPGDGPFDSQSSIFLGGFNRSLLRRELVAPTD